MQPLTRGLNCLPKKETVDIDGAVPAGGCKFVAAKKTATRPKCSPQAPHSS